MGDPRLDSIHLDQKRKDDFRRARDALLKARGDYTRIVEKDDLGALEGDPESQTMLHSLALRIPPDHEYCLMDKDAVYKLKIGLNTLGRLPDNDVVLADPYLSRRHCAVVVHTTDGAELHDVASKNGTFLNGRRISGPTKLASGDEIRMCDLQLIFVRRSDLPDANNNNNLPDAADSDDNVDRADRTIIEKGDLD